MKKVNCNKLNKKYKKNYIFDVDIHLINYFLKQ